MSALPSFEDVRSDMYRLLGDIEDVARSDWAPGTGPTREQAARSVKQFGSSV